MSKQSSRSTETSRSKTRTMALIVGEGSNPFEMSAAAEIFGLKRPELGFQPYEFIVCAEKKSTLMRDGVFRIQATHELRDALDADTIVVPNRPDPLVPQSGKVLQLIGTARSRNTRLVGFCTAAFTLAHAGVLGNRSVAVHWRWAVEFARRFPEVRVAPDVLYVEDDNIFTSAGSASALDLCLHIARQDFGSEVAHSISRRLVFALHRSGGQTQFAERPTITALEHERSDGVSRLLDELRTELGNNVSVANMAARVAMAPSTFHRHFLAEVGASPLAWLLSERIELARRLLETTDQTMDKIASDCGLGTATNLRERFRRQVGLTPTDYRRAHRQSTTYQTRVGNTEMLVPAR